ncbi:MAG: PKD domain-containing protein [Euryarchaeota archaeon]|nr:PKD domain-containing protein [Euryarchaeota archaeon]
MAALPVLGMLLLGALSVLPVAPGDEPPPGFSCALRVAPDGSLYPTPVNFTLPDLSGAERADQGRGLYCNIINQSGRVIPAETLRSLDENFTLYIWPNVTAAFGTPPYSKINIIIVNQDGMGGVAGYFSSGDPDAIYLDYDDLGLDLDVTAHEFQHLIHNSKDPGETIWLNEGCSECAIYVAYGGGNPGLTSHFMSYGLDTDNDFTAWNTVSDYGGAGLWTIYNYERYGGNDFTRALVADQARGVQSYNNRLAFKDETFTGAFRKWVVANWLNNASVDQGEWGYRGVWNYVGHTFLFKDYPMTCSSAVQQANGADYIRFEPAVWNQNGGDLEVNITFTSGTGYCAMAMAARSPVADRVLVPTITGNRATMLVPNLGGDYAVAGLAVSGLSGPCSYTFEASIIDITPPNTTARVTPPAPDGKNGWYRRLPTISFTVNENASIYYGWDGGAGTRYSAPFKAPEGVHELSFHGEDRYGNVEPPKSLTLKVDTIAPETVHNITPSEPDGLNGWYVSPAEISLIPDTPGAILSCAWDDDALHAYTGPMQLREGVHRLNWRAEDEAGNLEQLKGVITRLDTGLPTVDYNLSSEPDGQNGWYLRAPTIYLSSADPGNPVIYYSWDGGNVTEYTREFRAQMGRHTLDFYALDEAGNRGPPSSLVVKLDPVAPTMRATTGIPAPDGNDGWYRTETDLTLSTDEAYGATIYYSWDEGAEVLYDAPLPVPEGEHSISCRAIDEAGNRGKVLTLAFKMDSLPPVTQLGINPEDLGAAWYHERPRATLRTEPGASVMFSVDNTTFHRYVRPVEIGEGVTYLTYFSQDVAGNNETPSVRRFRVDTVPPGVLLNLSSTRVLTGEQVNLSAAAYDENGITEYLFDFGDGTTSAWTRYGNLSRSFGAPGNYGIRVKVRDGSGLEATSEPVLLNVSAPPRKQVSPPPTIGDLMASIPPLFYYLVFALVVAAVAGAGLRRVARARRRRRLYREVERAEAEREARHTREIDEEVSADYYGGDRALSSGGFRGGLPAGPAGGPGAGGGFRSVPPGAFAGEPAGRPSPSFRPPPDAPAERAGIPEAPATTAAPDGPAGPDFGDARLVERSEPELVLEAEIGSSKPIWAQSSKDTAQRSSRPARMPESALAGGRPARRPAGGSPDLNRELDDILKRLNRDNT